MKLTAIEPRVNDDVVCEVEELLARARAGEVLGLVYSAELTGHRLSTWSNFGDGVLLLGHLARQLALVNRGLDDARDG